MSFGFHHAHYYHRHGHSGRPAGLRVLGD